MSTPVLHVEDLSVIAGHGESEVTLVDRVSFDLAEGEILGLVGESGSGKTMACRALMRLLPSSNLRVQGKAVRLAGEDLLSLDEAGMRGIRGRRLGMIFQNPGSHLDPLMRIGEQIGEGIRLHQGRPSEKHGRRPLMCYARWAFPIRQGGSTVIPMSFPVACVNAP